MRLKSKHLASAAIGGLGLLMLVAAGPHGSGRAPLATLAQPMNRFLIQAAQPQALHELVPWLVHNQLDVAGVNIKAGTVEVVTSDAGLAFLRQNRIQGRLLERREPARGNEHPSSDTGLDPHYLNPERLTQKLQALAAAHPDVTRLEAIGKSLEGRPIWGLLISSTPKAGDPAYFEKPTIIFDGMHHAREIMTVEIVSDVADQLVAAVESRNLHAMDILKDWNVWVVPMLNVDGNNIVWTQDNWWRKNARGDGRSTFGVDINRNYPYRWANCNGSSSSHGAQDYHGEAGASEPETQALMGLAQRTFPAASLSYHSYGEYILYPYGCQGARSSENAFYERVAKEFTTKLPSDGRGTYTPGPPWDLLYPVDGDSMDQMYAIYGAFAFTFEVNQEFQPSYALREPTLRKHRGAWQYFLDRIDSSLLGVKVIDGKSGKPIQAQLAINTVTKTQGEAPYVTNPNGNFFKVLDQGNYVVSARTADGRAAQINVQMTGKRQLITLTVQ